MGNLLQATCWIYSVIMALGGNCRVLQQRMECSIWASPFFRESCSMSKVGSSATDHPSHSSSAEQSPLCVFDRNRGWSQTKWGCEWQCNSKRRNVNEQNMWGLREKHIFQLLFKPCHTAVWFSLYHAPLHTEAKWSLRVEVTERSYILFSNTFDSKDKPNNFWILATELQESPVWTMMWAGRCD